MNTQDSFVAGTVYYLGSKEDLAMVLSDAGIDVSVGAWALRLPTFGRAFELAYEGDLHPDAPFRVDGDGYDVPVENVARGCERLANCLQLHRIGFDFTHFSSDEEREIRTYSFSPSLV